MHRAVLAMSFFAIAATLAAVPGAATGATPTNVDVSQRLGNESEEAVAVNPTNPNNIVVVTNVGHAEAGLTAGMLEGVSDWSVSILTTTSVTRAAIRASRSISTGISS
jgi:hypothetical protein